MMEVLFFYIIRPDKEHHNKINKSLINAPFWHKPDFLAETDKEVGILASDKKS